jgi:excisionase family DNA binding protein
MQKALKTVQQAADELALAPVTIRTWLAQRKLKYVKLGRSVRIPASEIERLINENTVPSRR